MAYLTPDEINTHLYGEVVEEISRDNADLMQNAIDTAIDEAYGYLRAYDVDAIFSTTGSDRNNALLVFVKDIAIWHFINLSNVAVEMELRLKRYEKAIQWLQKVQDGKTNPQLPVKEVIPPQQDKSYIKWGSNRKTNYNF